MVLHPVIHQKPLENRSLDLQSAYNQAYTLDLVQKISDACNSSTVHAMTNTTATIQAKGIPDNYSSCCHI